MWRTAVAGATALSLMFLILPIAALIPMSFSTQHFLAWPPALFSLQWYRAFLGDRDWMDSLGVSLRVAVLATVLACALGTPAGIGLARHRFPGRDLLYSLIVAPVIVPVLIIAISAYLMFASLHLVGTISALALTHSVLGVPFVVINVLAVMRTVDVQLELAARNLGATPWQTFRRVTAPLVRAGILVGALLVFITSLDEAVVALFLSGKNAITLPRMMWDSIMRDELNPTVTAIASLQIGLVVAGMLGMEIARGRRARRAERPAGPEAVRAAGEGFLYAASAAPAGAGLRLVNLTKQFGAVRAVDRASLEVRPAEFLTLLGPSGSGKTTILNMVAGFETPTEGEILLGGVDVTRQPPDRRGMGMVFQNYALFPHMTVLENIAFPLRVRRMRGGEVEARVGEALRLVRLDRYGARYPRQLSGGEQQRVALARALVFNPRLLLMDEPLAALDKHLRENMQIELRRLHEHLNITILFVTHDQTEAMTMSDRIAVINRGRIEQVGTPAELYETPANAFIAGFIGESNFLEGTVASLNGREAVVRSAGGLHVTVPAPGIAVGDRLRVVIRPESVRVLADAAGHANAVPAQVEEVIYLGDVIKVVVRAASEETFVVKQPNRKGMRAPEPGSRVFVAWAVEDARVLVPDSADG
ncbi:MAG TPA: polyamine ABC transporter ATP-binding protein [bacterium]|nr:polyamine ABC transporter ATP-binding protein [bacterium]